MHRTLTSRLVFLPLLLAAANFACAAGYLAPESVDYTIHDFKFRSGEVLPELRIHYRTLGKPRTEARGLVRNAVLILHGTTGSGAQFIRPEFAGELFGTGTPPGGSGMEIGRWLDVGDRLRLVIEDVGEIEHEIVERLRAYQPQRL